MAFLFLLVPSILSAESAPSELSGVWEAQRTFEAASGPLYLVRHSKESWTAEMEGFRVKAEVRDGGASFSLPGDLGSFRGQILADGTISGHWIQSPPLRLSSQAYASPLDLVPAGEGVWRGEVETLPDRMTLFLTLTPREDGILGAVLGNPERNIGAFVMADRLEVEEERLRLVGSFRWNADEEQTLAEGMKISEDLFSVVVPDLGGTYDFYRVDAQRVSAYFPGLKESYEYRRPPTLQDGWPTATPEEVGMLRAPLEGLVRTILTTPPGTKDQPAIHAILVARKGRLVLEEYFHGHDREDVHDTRSASKSLTGLLAGAAGVDPELYVYGTLRPKAVPEGAAEMTLRHLLTMSSGLACDDGDGSSPGNEDRMQNQQEQPDWVAYTLDLELVNVPGEKAAYCSAGINLAGALLAKKTGQWLPDLFHRHLAKPLGLGDYFMNLTPTGEAYAGGGLRIQGRDFLKFGQILLNSGTWDGKQVVPAAWIEDSLAPAVEMSGEGYDLGWWHITYPWRGGETKAIYAGGNGGQYVIVVPELELAVAFFGGNYGQRVMHRSKREYVPEYVLKAVR